MGDIIIRQEEKLQILIDRVNQIEELLKKKSNFKRK